MVWLILPGVLVLLVLLALWITHRIAYAPPTEAQKDPYNISAEEQYQARKEEMYALIAALARRPCERVSITSHDGLTLTGRYYHAADGAPLDISFHGYRGHALRDFCGGSRISFALGHNLLLVDQRAHGDSEGRAITFGAMERLDCRAWIGWANERFGCPEIALFGVSMGAATVLLAAALDLPENVTCVVADSPYSRAEDIIVTVGQGMHLPPFAVRAAARAAAYIYGGFRLDDASPVEALRRAKVPVLLLHGEDDRLVPCAMSAVLEEACTAPVERFTFPEAGHGLSYLVDEAGYTAAVITFLDRARAMKKN